MFWHFFEQNNLNCVNARKLVILRFKPYDFDAMKMNIYF